MSRSEVKLETLPWAKHAPPVGLQASATGSTEFRAHWRLLLAAMIATGLGFPAVPFYSIGIFAPILAQQFGWSFASILGGLMVVPVVLLIGGPAVGLLVDKYGARKVASLSLAGLGLSYVSFAFATGSIVQYYASWFAVAITGIGATPIAMTRAVTGVFVRRRGLALGITLTGIGLFAFGVKPFGAWCIEIGGWRVAIAAIGMLPLLIGAPLVLWGFANGDDERRGARVPLNNPVTPVTDAAAGYAVPEALRSRAFWLMVAACLPIAFATGAPLPNMENILRLARLDASDIVMLTSFVGATTIAGRLLGGWLIDRLWAPSVAAMVLLAAAFALSMLSQPSLGYREALLAIFLLGFAIGVEVDLFSYLVARYIGMRSYGVIYGTLFGLFAIGTGFGPALLALAYDDVGNYAFALRVCAALLVVAAGLLLMLGRYPDSIGRASKS